MTSTHTKRRSLSPRAASILSVRTNPSVAKGSLCLTDVPSIRFSTVEQVTKVIDEVGSNQHDVLHVTGITRPQFTELEENREKGGRKYRFFHLPQHQLLIITVPTGIHERAHRELYDTFLDQVKEMGLKPAWRLVGSEKLKEKGPGGSSREGDSGGNPLAFRHTKDWPTLVIEAGVSQTLQNLRTTIRWWFDASKSAVKIVLLVKVDRSTRQLTIEKWTEGLANPTRITRAQSASSLTPILRQVIKIDMSPEASILPIGSALHLNPDSYVIAGDELLLEFELVFLRAPIPPERNFIITHEMLQVFAVDVWK